MENYLGETVFWALGAAFLGGTLASLSPCVYPMIPVVSAYVGSRTVGERTRFKSFLLSLAYVVGMAVVYALLGMIAALTGSFFGQISTNPWALLIVALILFLFALNILELIPFPSWFAVQAKDPALGGVFGAFCIGAVSGLVASPCTSPVLFSLLTFVATTQNVIFGGALLFVFSLGMGLLLVVVGTFSGLAATLPKPGKWMLVVKRSLGLLMLGLALYYLVRAVHMWR